ncbi:MAG: hypothetical protein J6A92_03460 [Lachnospiraceae bacterium]|nr:hypothetical protein [Lachnospiraceae bacterium]
MNENEQKTDMEQITESSKNIKMDEINKIVEQEKKESEPNYISLGLAIGLSLGTCFGVIFDKLSLGMGLGMCIGVAVSILVAYKNVKVDDENKNEKDNKVDKTQV